MARGSTENDSCGAASFCLSSVGKNSAIDSCTCMQERKKERKEGIGFSQWRNGRGGVVTIRFHVTVIKLQES